MTFIDWSDSEGMVGLLVDFVADESKECGADKEREDFLANLLRELTTIEQRISAIPATQTIRALKGLREGVAHEFANDPVMVHIEACIEELVRVHDHERANNSLQRL